MLSLQAKVAELQAQVVQHQARAGQVQNLPALIAENQLMIWTKRLR